MYWQGEQTRYVKSPETALAPGSSLQNRREGIQGHDCSQQLFQEGYCTDAPLGYTVIRNSICEIIVQSENICLSLTEISNASTHIHKKLFSDSNETKPPQN